MPYTDRYKNASYKGHLFQIVDHNYNGGKKGKDSDYANLDGGSADDLGNKQRAFQVNAIAGGENFDVVRTELENVLRSKGTGELILPYHPPINALASKWSVKEGIVSGEGVAQISIDFVEVAEDVPPPSTQRR